MNSTSNIFDVEQSIMQCWGVVDDLKLLTEQVYDRPQPLTEDELGNILIGMQTLYQLKFEKCFEEFEELCKNYHKYRKVYEAVERSRDDGK
jgi:hypothetical protein